MCARGVWWNERDAFNKIPDGRILEVFALQTFSHGRSRGLACRTANIDAASSVEAQPDLVHDHVAFRPNWKLLRCKPVVACLGCSRDGSYTTVLSK